MITIIRRNQRILMLVIAILTIIAFAWLYNPATPGELRSGAVARIYDKNLSQADIDREVRNFQLALQMGQYEMIGELGGMARDERQGLQEFIWNLLVVQHEARKFGIEPTNAQMENFLKSVAAFQTDGQFDPRKYKAFIDENLGPKGFTEMQLEVIARDALNLQTLKSVIASPVSANPAEIAEAMRAFQKIDLQIVRFPAVDAATLTVSDEEIKTFFDANKAALITPEGRVVKYVEFVLPADQAAATGKAKVDAQQKLWDAAGVFAEQAAAAPSFDAAAQTAGLKVAQTPEFDRSGTSRLAAQLAGLSGANVSMGDDLKGLAPAAFVLSEQKPVSDAVQVGDKFYVLKLETINPERPLTLDEVRPMAEVRLRMAKAAQATRDQAAKAIASLRDAVGAGKPFADAATAQGLKVETVSGLEPAKMQEQTVPVDVVRLSLLMNPAQLSDYLPSQDGGGLAFYLVSRAPVAGTPEEQAKQQAEVRGNIIDGKRRMLFLTWLDSARDAAGIAAVNSPQ